MAYGFTSGATAPADSIRFGDVAITDSLTKLTLSYWVKYASMVDFMAHMGDINNDQTMGWYIGASGSGAGTSGDIIVLLTNGVQTYGYTTSLGLSTGTWHHIFMRYDGFQSGNPDKIGLYVNGVGPKTLTFAGPGIPNSLGANSITVGQDPPANELSLGRYLSYSAPLSGSLAEVGIWPNSGIIDTAVIAALANGFAPSFFRNQGNLLYFSLKREATDAYGLVGTPTIAGTTVTDHPRMIYPRDRPTLQKASAVAAPSGGSPWHTYRQMRSA